MSGRIGAAPFTPGKASRSSFATTPGSPALGRPSAACSEATAARIVHSIEPSAKRHIGSHRLHEIGIDPAPLPDPHDSRQLAFRQLESEIRATERQNIGHADVSWPSGLPSSGTAARQPQVSSASCRSNAGIGPLLGWALVASGLLQRLTDHYASFAARAHRLDRNRLVRVEQALHGTRAEAAAAERGLPPATARLGVALQQQ